MKKDLIVLKKHFSKITHKGVNIWPIIFVQFYYMFAEKEGLKKNWNKPSWRTILGHLFLKDNYNIVNPYGKILASFFWERKENKNLFELCVSDFGKNELTKIYRKKGLKKFSFSFPSIKHLKEIYKKMDHKEIKRIFGSKKKFLHFLAYVYYQFKTIDILKKFVDKNNFEEHVGFESSYHRSEIILAQLLKNLGKPTFVLQHGVIYDFKKMDGGELYYKNDIPDYYLLWGEKTKKSIRKYLDKKKLLIVGNPKYTKIIKRKSAPLKKGVLFLSHSSFRKSSDNLLKIVSNFLNKNPSIKIKLKLHPNENLDSYKNFRNLENLEIVNKYASPSELMENADFVIMHNTALALEALSFGIPRFIFKDKVSQDLSDFKDLFSNEKEFSNLVKKYSKKENYNKLMKNYEKEFKYNFFQPKTMSIPQYYRKTILEKIKSSY